MGANRQGRGRARLIQVGKGLPGERQAVWPGCVCGCVLFGNGLLILPGNAGLRARFSSESASTEPRVPRSAGLRECQVYGVWRIGAGGSPHRVPALRPLGNVAGASSSRRDSRGSGCGIGCSRHFEAERIFCRKHPVTCLSCGHCPRQDSRYAFISPERKRGKQPCLSSVEGGCIVPFRRYDLRGRL